jgi:L-lactate dehydrogenase complex protein LldF
MNMAGKLKREGRPVKARHVAEVLAGDLDTPAIGEAVMTCMSRRRPPSRPTPARRSANPLQKALRGNEAAASSTSARKAPRGAARVRRAARRGARHQEHTLAHLDLYLEAYERRSSPAAATCTGPRPPRRRARIVLDICRKAGAKTVTKGKSMISEEIGLNDTSRRERHHAGRDRPRRIHHPASRRAPEPHHRPAVHVNKDGGRGRFPRAHTHLPPTAT